MPGLAVAEKLWLAERRIDLLAVYTAHMRRKGLRLTLESVE